MYKIVQISTIICLSFALSCFGQAIDVQLSARNLVSGDLIWGAPDPFVKVSYAIGSNSYSLVGKTATLHTKNPDWTETFQFQYVAHLDQNLLFEVIENDAFVDDKYGSVAIKMVDLVNSASVQRDFGKGTLIIKRVN